MEWWEMEANGMEKAEAKNQASLQSSNPIGWLVRMAQEEQFARKCNSGVQRRSVQCIEWWEMEANGMEKAEAKNQRYNCQIPFDDSYSWHKRSNSRERQLGGAAEEK
jgi:hypothetical protein